MQNFDCIIAVGCSHTFGYEHKSTNNGTRPSKDTFIDLLGRHLGVPVHNFSQPGGSNQTILRRLMVAVEFAKANNHSPLFFLQWTQPERFETHVADTVGGAEDWPWLRTNTEINDKSKNNKLKKWAEDFYRLYDAKALVYESLKTIHHANALMKGQYPLINCFAKGWDLPSYKFTRYPGFVSSDSISNNSVYSNTLRQWYKDHGYEQSKVLWEKHQVEAFDREENDPWKDDMILCLLWDQIAKHDWWLYNRGWHHGLLDCCEENNLEIGPEGHAMESAHEWVFNHMLEDSSSLNCGDGHMHLNTFLNVSQQTKTRTQSYTSKDVLEFEHVIPIEVHHDTDDSTLQIKINGKLKFDKKYDKGTHREVIRFTHPYTDGASNSLTISYDGEVEAENRYVKVNDMLINGVRLNKFNSTYRPKLNKVWWDSLDDREKDYYKDIIYGDNGNHFGWYGRISWNYYTGKDRSTRTKVTTSSAYDNTDDILSMKMEWIYGDSTDHDTWEITND